MDLTSFSRALASLARRSTHQDNVTSTSPDDLPALLLLATDMTDWSYRATGLLGLEELVGKRWKEEDTTTKQEMWNEIKTTLRLVLEDQEPRVRDVACKLLRTMCMCNPTLAWEEFSNVVVDIAKRNFQLTEEERGIESERLGIQQTNRKDNYDDDDDNVVGVATSITNDKPLPIELIVRKTKMYTVISWAPSMTTRRGTPKPRADSSIASARSLAESGAIVLMVHETMGWKALESSLRYLDILLRGQSLLQPNEPILDLICNQACTHENRYVREVGFEILTILVQPFLLPVPPHPRAGLALERIARGMDDSWAQVRLKACWAARTFALDLVHHHQQTSSSWWSLLLPRLCFNRYHVADGVRTYSQETWRMVFTSHGPQTVAQHIIAVTTYYGELCTSADDTIRESACHCITELATKIQHDAVAPHVVMMMERTRLLLRDSSWLVRSAAAMATSRLCIAFPDSTSNFRTDLYEAWFNNICGSIWSVRRDSAVALGDVMRTYPSDLIPRVQAKITEWAGRAFVDEHHHTKAKAKTTTKDHEDQHMFSCCTPMPSSANVKFRKPQPWEYTDGALYLIVELAKVLGQSAHDGDAADVNMAVFLDICRHAETHQHFGLLETSWKQLPELVQAVGKRMIKLKYLDDLLVCLCTSLKKRNEAPLSACGAAEAIRMLNGWIGQGVFHARLENAGLIKVVEANPPESFDSRPNLSGQAKAVTFVKA